MHPIVILFLASSIGLLIKVYFDIYTSIRDVDNSRIEYNDNQTIQIKKNSVEQDSVTPNPSSSLCSEDNKFTDGETKVKECSEQIFKNDSRSNKKLSPSSSSIKNKNSHRCSQTLSNQSKLGNFLNNRKSNGSEKPKLTYFRNPIKCCKSWQSNLSVKDVESSSPELRENRERTQLSVPESKLKKIRNRIN